MIVRERFIDLAAHGGCSKKGAATEVRALLEAVGKSCSNTQIGLISKNFPDSGLFQFGGISLLSTTDIVLPMTLSPSDFGRVAVNHVLSDIYASGGLSLFALCMLGLPRNMPADSDFAVAAMAAAVEQLSAESSVLVGGHTMADQEDFFLGFSAVGRPIGSVPFPQGASKNGDVLILTKPLGTSVATLRWKMEEATEVDHEDVLKGMLRSNRDAALFLSKCDLHASTDVTGYGLLGHLFNILFASGVAARVWVSKLPCYESILPVTKPDQSRQSWHNLEYVRGHLKVSTQCSQLAEALMFDSQVSGGLLISIEQGEADVVLSGLRKLGFAAQTIGEVCVGEPGQIEIVG